MPKKFSTATNMRNLVKGLTDMAKKSVKEGKTGTPGSRAVKRRNSRTDSFFQPGNHHRKD